VRPMLTMTPEIRGPKFLHAPITSWLSLRELRFQRKKTNEPFAVFRSDASFERVPATG